MLHLNCFHCVSYVQTNCLYFRTYIYGLYVVINGKWPIFNFETQKKLSMFFHRLFDIVICSLYIILKLCFQSHKRSKLVLKLRY